MWQPATNAFEQEMSVPTDALRVSEFRIKDAYRVTQRGVTERLADPYLTDHDRWVLGQFARFLSGPDARARHSRRACATPPHQPSDLVLSRATHHTVAIQREMGHDDEH
jgi:hypothetical protein